MGPILLLVTLFSFQNDTTYFERILPQDEMKFGYRDYSPIPGRNDLAIGSRWQQNGIQLSLLRLQGDHPIVLQTTKGCGDCARYEPAFFIAESRILLFLNVSGEDGSWGISVYEIADSSFEYLDYLKVVKWDSLEVGDTDAISDCSVFSIGDSLFVKFEGSRLVWEDEDVTHTENSTLINLRRKGPLLFTFDRTKRKFRKL